MMNIFKLVFIMVLVNVSTITLCAQTDTSKKHLGCFAIMPYEYIGMNYKELNNTLSDYGFPLAQHNRVSVGFGLQCIFNRFITSFTLHKATKGLISDYDFTTTNYSSISFDFGYDLAKKSRYSIYPYIGYKQIDFSYEYKEKKFNSPTEFENYFQTNHNYKLIESSQGHFDFGFSISHQMVHFVSIKCGYLIPLEEFSWSMNVNEGPLTNSPNNNYTFYLSFTLGLGYINELQFHDD